MIKVVVILSERSESKDLHSRASIRAEILRLASLAQDDNLYLNAFRHGLIEQ